MPCIHKYGIAFFCALFLVLCSALPWAHAEVKRFATFSMDVPAHWTVHEEGGAISFKHPELLCTIDVLIVPHQDVPFRELGIAFYQNLKGTKAKDEGHGMSFQLRNAHNIPSHVFLSTQGPYFCGVTSIGNCIAYESALASITILTDTGEAFPHTKPLYVSPSAAAKEAADKAQKNPKTSK